MATFFKMTSQFLALSRHSCLAACLVFALAGCQKPLERKLMMAVEQNATVDRDGILYRVDSGEVVNGYVKDESAGQDHRILYQVKDGKRSGEFLSWHSNGKKHLQGTYLDGLMHGAWTSWDANGTKLWENHRQNGELHGKVTWWYETGFKKFECTYDQGKKEGEEIVWLRNGLIGQRRGYRKGERDGKWSTWDEKGRLLKEEIYRDDKLIESKKLPDFFLRQSP